MAVEPSERWRSTWPISASEAPARSMSVAAVWRSRRARTTPSPARRAAAATMRRHPAAGQADERRLHPQEHLPHRGRARAAAAQVRGDRLADIDRQRQLVHAVALAVHRELPGPPVQVVEAQRRDLVRPQPEPQDQHDHRVVTSTGGTSPITRAQQRLRLRRSDPLRQQRPSPPRHRQRRRRQVALDQPGRESSSAGTNAARTRSAAPTPATTADLVQHRVRHVRRGQLAQLASIRGRRGTCARRRRRRRR